MHGFLNIDKPAGMTSHDVVARVRRLAGKGVKVGHAGTLDPMATGVLPMALGHATRLIEYLTEARKGYHGTVRLGVATSTDDGEGEPLATRPVPLLNDATIEAAVAPLRGAIQQVPPIYSALHHEGRRLYELARAGQSVELAPRPVTIYRLEWALAGPNELHIAVECSKGTYVRSLARDIGAALGCGGHLAALRRTLVGQFAIDSATPLERLLAEPAQLPALLLPPEVAVADWPVLDLDESQAQRVRNGLPLQLPAMASPQARAHSSDGVLLALLRFEGGAWRPDKVFV